LGDEFWKEEECGFGKLSLMGNNNNNNNSTPMEKQTVPLRSEHIKTPKMTNKTLKMDHGSSGHDLFYMWP
jgi:hypothetical protein